MQSFGFIKVMGSTALRTEATLDVMQESLVVLEEAMDGLNLPIGDRPRPKPAVIAVPRQQVEDWDSYYIYIYMYIYIFIYIYI
jgi:hypothetical protein